MKEARRLGMGVDMSPVSGWGFGGPWVKSEDVARKVSASKLTVFQAREKLKSPEAIKNISALMAYSSKGEVLDLTMKIKREGLPDWNEPADGWTLYLLENSPSGSPTRMSSPGGKGPAVDHLSIPALKRYFERFNEAFQLINKEDIPRAFMNDSWELYLDWTGDFLDEFESRHGYDLRYHLPEFMGYGDEEKVTRVVCDYRHTLSDLMVDHFTVIFREWAYSHGRRISGETINEPANEIDLNVLYDIPRHHL